MCNKSSLQLICELFCECIIATISELNRDEILWLFILGYGKYNFPYEGYSPIEIRRDGLQSFRLLTAFKLFIWSQGWATKNDYACTMNKNFEIQMNWAVNRRPLSSYINFVLCQHYRYPKPHDDLWALFTLATLDFHSWENHLKVKVYVDAKWVVGYQSEASLWSCDQGYLGVAFNLEIWPWWEIYHF